ncbi:hypothetical protein B0H63DRAFT_218690 [Podospora didyma]|uniref:Uncharacterized protein n=1 Tax=Podospora didyma TaxID=330526 RepID=A0AAE0TWB5_9PEZI|nr:hypothetical protein B0H63DRAFT_218690 [Podospora didyma]
MLREVGGQCPLGRCSKGAQSPDHPRRTTALTPSGTPLKLPVTPSTYRGQPSLVSLRRHSQACLLMPSLVVAATLSLSEHLPVHTSTIPPSHRLAHQTHQPTTSHFHGDRLATVLFATHSWLHMSLMHRILHTPAHLPLTYTNLSHIKHTHQHVCCLLATYAARQH